MPPCPGGPRFLSALTYRVFARPCSAPHRRARPHSWASRRPNRFAGARVASRAGKVASVGCLPRPRTGSPGRLTAPAWAAHAGTAASPLLGLGQAGLASGRPGLPRHRTEGAGKRGVVASAASSTWVATHLGGPEHISYIERDSCSWDSTEVFPRRHGTSARAVCCARGSSALHAVFASERTRAMGPRYVVYDVCLPRSYRGTDTSYEPQCSGYPTYPACLHHISSLPRYL